MGRLTWDEYFLNIAREVSKRSTCIKRQYGAIIVDKNNTIISTGYNGSPRGEVNCCDTGICKRLNKAHNTGDYSDCHSIHAEQNCLINAARYEILGGTMYLWGGENGLAVDCEPCPICSRMIKNAGIMRVVCSKKVDFGQDLGQDGQHLDCITANNAVLHFD